MKSIERFLCRLEFHASKVSAGDQGHCGATSVQPWDGCAVPRPAPHRSSGLSLQIDELYEAYCIQRRLRDGAHNMVKAYSTGSPGSREARESLAEASKGYKEYTEVRQPPGVGWQGAGSHRWLLMGAVRPSVPRTCVCWRTSWRASWASSMSG